MSVITTVYVPDGIVMAADSRLTITMTPTNKTGGTPESARIFSASDNSQKIMFLSKVNIGISACGLAVLDDIAVADYIRTFEIRDVKASDTVSDVAHKLASCTKKFGTATQFHVSGYTKDEPFVHMVSNGDAKRINFRSKDKSESTIDYGTAWNGEPIAIKKLLSAEPGMAINFNLMPLRDAIDFAEFLVDSTIKYQRFEMKPKTCGGEIDILVLTKDDAFWHRHKVYKPRA